MPRAADRGSPLSGFARPRSRIRTVERTQLRIRGDPGLIGRILRPNNWYRFRTSLGADAERPSHRAPPPPAPAGLRVCRDRDARARHRRQRGGVQRDARGAAQASSLPGCGSHRSRRHVHARLRGRFCRRPLFRGLVVVGVKPLECHRRGRAGADSRRAGQRLVLPDARGRAASGRFDHGADRATAGSCALVRLLAAAFRRKVRRAGTIAATRRARVHRDRRDAAGVPAAFRLPLRNLVAPRDGARARRHEPVRSASFATSHGFDPVSRWPRHNRKPTRSRRRSRGRIPRRMRACGSSTRRFSRR